MRLEVPKVDLFLEELEQRGITEAAAAGQYKSRNTAHGVVVTDFFVLATARDVKAGNLLLVFKEHIGTSWFQDDAKKINAQAFTRAEEVSKTLEKAGIRVIRGWFNEGDEGASE